MIIDSFPFNKDFNTLKIRLAELNDIVDVFIVAESSYTHSGKPKPLYLSENISEFKDYSNKLVVVQNNRKYITLNPRIRELRQRQLISTYLKNYKLTVNDLIIHSDCDEIPRRTVIENLARVKRSYNILLELDCYSTRLNLKAGLWARVRIVSGENYKSIAKLRQDIFLEENYDLRRHRFPIIRVPDYWTHRYFGLWKFPQIIFSKPSLQIIKNGGWHFNNLFAVENLIDKVEAFSHQELNTQEIRNQIIEHHQAGRDILHGTQFHFVPIDETFPEIIYRNQTLWSNFIGQ